MKVIISHDVDHFEPMEHLGDLFIPKYTCRAGLEVLLGRIPFAAGWHRIRQIMANRLSQIEPLARFDRENGIPSTFFVATANGRSISYSIEISKHVVDLVMKYGHRVGLHAIAHENVEEVSSELGRLARLTGETKHGLRVHDIGFVRHGSHIEPPDPKRIAGSGAVFSSSTFGPGHPTNELGMWEFPIVLMDSDLFMGTGRLQGIGLGNAKARTMAELDEATKRGDEYLSILFHDPHFSPAFPDYLEWYVWLVAYLRSRGVQLISYHDAVAELNLTPAARDSKGAV